MCETSGSGSTGLASSQCSLRDCFLRFLMDWMNQTVLEPWSSYFPVYLHRKHPFAFCLSVVRLKNFLSAVQKFAKVIHLDTIQLEGNGHDSRRFIEQVLNDVARKASYSWYITPLNLERAEGMFCGFILQFKESTNALIRRTSRTRSGNCHQGWEHFTTAWLARSQIILIAILRDLHTTFWSGPHVLGD